MDETVEKTGSAKSGFIKIIVFVIIVSLLMGLKYYYDWQRKNCPPIVREPISGSISSMMLNNNGQDTRIVDESMRPDGMLMKDIPEFEQNHLNMSIMFWIRPDNNAQHRSLIPIDQKQIQKTFLNDLPNKTNIYPILFSQINQDFQVMYDSINNDLLLRIRILYYIDENNQMQYQQVRFRNVLKIQKWNMMLLSLNNRHVDLYLNGELFESILLNNVPMINNVPWALYPGLHPFEGRISSLQMFTFSLKRHDAKRLYNYNKPFFKPHPQIGKSWWFFLPKQYFFNM